MSKRTFLFFVLIVILAGVLRFYKLGAIPPGIHMDEVSHGYNAFSFIETGRDRYGKLFPILFRSFGSYQPPVLTYLTIIPVAIFGNTVFAARFINAVFGVLLTIVTFFFSLAVFNIKDKKKLDNVSLISSLLVAISPWSVVFSRQTAEANLGVAFFVLGLLFLVRSLKRNSDFILASISLAVSTHAYYSERINAVLVMIIFLLLFARRIKLEKVLIGLLLFGILMFPHILIVNSGALTRRLDQVGFHGSWLAFFSNFFEKYISYFSPANLFLDPGKNLGRIVTNIGPYFLLLFPFFLLGIGSVFKFIKERIVKKFLLLTFLISPIPAALTGDYFYPLRALDFLWFFLFPISFGLFIFTHNFLKGLWGKGFLFTILLIFLFSLYKNYFLLSKYEAGKYFGFQYIQLLDHLRYYKDKRIIIDSSRDPGIGLRLAYLIKYPPSDLQSQLHAQLKTSYYSSDVELQEVYKLGNIEVRPFSWKDPCLEATMIVADILTLSPEKAEEKKMKLVDEIRGLDDNVYLKIFETNPQELDCKKSI